MTELEILLIEDDQLQRKALFDTLKKEGHKVQACECLTDAKKILKKNAFELILLDMHLPDGNGLDFLKKQKSEGLSTDIVIITAFADVESAINAIKIGAYDYLPKPFEHEELDKIIRNVSSKVELTQKVDSLSQLTLGSGEDVYQFDNMIGTNKLTQVFKKANKLAGFSDTTVLILGETGTGKGMLANAIHRSSNRADKPFVEINCSAIPEQLIESEIFGYEKGAFTDAKNKKPGLLELANCGTVFLDEIGDMELSLQSKILKVIEERSFRRLGAAKTITVDVRIIAATSRDLKQMVKDGTFREDLYYRLSVLPFTMPPLRDHSKSIEPLAEHYLTSFGKEMGHNFKGFSKEAKTAMVEYSWPGNVRELRNAVERSVILSSGDLIEADALGLTDGSVRPQDNTVESDFDSEPMSLVENEKRLISKVLKSVKGNKNKAADILKIHRTTLYKKIEEYDI